MLNELDKILRDEVSFACIECESELSSMFLILYFVEKFLKNDGHVIFVSTRMSFNSIKIVCGKMAIRLDSKHFQFLQLNELLDYSLNDAKIFDRLEQKITKLIDHERKNLLVFDDFESIRQLNSSLSAQYGDLRFLQRLRRIMPDLSLTLIECCEADFIALDVLDVVFRIKTIGSGFGVNVTGELEVCQRNACCEPLYSSQMFHYLVGERSSKLFYPGTIKLVM